MKYEYTYWVDSEDDIDNSTSATPLWNMVMKVGSLL